MVTTADNTSPTASLVTSNVAAAPFPVVAVCATAVYVWFAPPATVVDVVIVLASIPPPASLTKSPTLNVLAAREVLVNTILSTCKLVTAYTSGCTRSNALTFKISPIV